MAKSPSPMQVAKDEVAYLERTFGGLPSSQSASAGTGDADGLLKFSYHQNPYLRTFVKVLWSGYAIARGQLAEGHQRFSQARRDSIVSAVDALTTKALDDAHTALENAMAPNGTITDFLQVLRERTLQRLWTRVCETSGLPPPRFHLMLGLTSELSREEADAADAAELASLRLHPPAELAPAAASSTSRDDEEDGDEGDDDHEDEEGAPSQERLQVTVQRRGGAETAAELVLAAAAELLRELRTKGATGAITLTLTVQGDASSATGGDRKRGRRRRRR